MTADELVAEWDRARDLWLDPGANADNANVAIFIAGKALRYWVAGLPNPDDDVEEQTA